MKNSLTVLIGSCLVTVVALCYCMMSSADTLSSVSNNRSILRPMNTTGFDLKKMSLLDPERFSMKNQYIMNFSSMSGSGSLMGMYINTMEYRFNSPLVVKLQVAYQSRSNHLFGNRDSFTRLQNNEQGRLFIPSFDLIYRPWKNTIISLSYRDYSSGNPLYWYGGRRSYGYSPFMEY